MRTLEFTAEGETYRAVVRQGLATIQDRHGRLVRVHRIDGGRPQPSPDDAIMARLVATIKETKGGSEYLKACSSVRAARDSARLQELAAGGILERCHDQAPFVPAAL